MFKKLKEKITEEVKISPQRLQQLTQSVSDRLQNSSAPSDENFFSIGDDDANTSSSSVEPGFTSVALMSPQDSRFRRNSNSSMASDVSFLPRYESVANMYHLQSDLDVSASELEDNASTSSSLGHLSKEQIYSAFQKSQSGYHKYRGRYTDLARHYKEMEREIVKMKAVLVETQDKAIRRVTELKEQCTLEQKAKAHLEAALRDEIDERQLKIQSLQTKVELMKNGNSQEAGESLENLTRYLNDARQEIEHLNEKIQEMKANSIIFQSKEQEYKAKIGNLEREIAQFGEREKENNLTLAQTKMELHNELVSKEAELSSAKQENEMLKQNQEALEPENGSKLENLQTQNKKLIEKLEALTQKCNTYESDLLKMEQVRIENKNLASLNSDLKHQLEIVRQEAKTSILSLEVKVREKITKEFALKENELKEEFRKKFEEVSSNSDNLQEIQLKLIEKDQEIKKAMDLIDVTKKELSSKAGKYNELEGNHLELIEDSVGLRSKNSGLEKELVGLQNKFAKLEGESKNSKEVQEENVNLRKSVKALEERVRIFEEKDEVIDLENTESKLLEMKLQKVEEENKDLRESFEKERKIFEKLLHDNSKLQESEEKAKYLDERMKLVEEELSLAKTSNNQKELQIVEVSKEKERLQTLIVSLEERVRIFEEKNEAIDLENTESKLLEMKLQKLEEENKELQDSFERERKVFEKLLHDNHKLQESEEKAKYLDERIREMEEELFEAKSSNSQKAFDIVEVSNEKERLQKLIVSLEDKVRIFEEKDEAIELERTESRLLEMKLQKLEEEKDNLVESFESERRLFEDIRRDNLNLKENLERVKSLEEDLVHLRSNFNAQEIELNQVSQEREKLQAIVKKLEEKIRIFEEKDEAIELELTESRLLEMKLQKLEEEKTNLVESFESERKVLLQENELKVSLQHELKQKLEEELKATRENVKIFEETIELESRQKIEGFEETLTGKKREFEELAEEKIKLESIVASLKDRIVDLEEKLKERELLSNEERQRLQNELTKSKQIEDKSIVKEEELKKIFGRFIQERCEDITQTLTKLAGGDSNNVNNWKEKNFSTLEEQLQYVEELFAKEKENLTKIFNNLKICETKLTTSEEEKEKLKENLQELEGRNNQVVQDNNFLSEENQTLVAKLEELKLKSEDESYKTLENENFKTQSKHFAELERNFNDLLHEKQLLLDEIQELKTAPVNTSRVDNLELVKQEKSINGDTHLKELEILKDKITKYKSLDLTNKSSLEFYENELEKLRNQNEKISRKLDETLVTLNHCAELSSSTEIEYLRNVLYNYMLGKESLVLARVIAAVCKFDREQTETVLAKEQQKQSLLGQLGIL